MGIAARILIGIIGLAPSVALAEYCWMVGCENEIGYLPARSAIFGASQLKEGMVVTVANYAYLRQQAIEKPQGVFVLGPGTTVKVLELIGTRDGKFAIVRVVKANNTRRDECKSTIGCTATFH